MTTIETTIAPPARVGPSARRKQLSLLVLCAAVFLDALDTSLLGVSLPSIKNAIGLSDGALQWLVSGYTVGCGGFLLLGGRVADLWGRKRSFMVATAVFVITSVLGGVFTSGALLVGTRVLKGISAGFTAPAAMSLITTTFRQGPERNRALSVFATTAASGYSLGLVISGALTEVSWRLVFFVPGLIALAVLAASPLIPADSPAKTMVRKFDLAGAVTVTAGVMALILGLVEAPGWGWDSPRTLGALAAAVLLLAAFVLVEARHRAPLVPLGLFRNATLSSANLMTVVWASSTIGWQFITTLYLQGTLHYSPLRTAFAVLPMGLCVLIFANLMTGRLTQRWGTRPVAVIGMLLQGLGVLMLARVGVHGAYWAVVFPGIVIHGIGNGLVYPTINIAGVSGVENERQGAAAGLITASNQIGAGIGVAVLTAVMTGTAQVAGVDGFRWAFVGAAIFSMVGMVIAMVGLPRGRTRQGAPAA
jgi:MFS family permease